MNRRARGAALVLAAGLAAGLPGVADERPAPVVTSLTLFAGNAEGLWRSRDWGGSWQRVDAAGLEGLGAAHAILPIGPQVLVGGDGGLFVSEDFGESWKRRSDVPGVQALLISRYPQSDPTVFAGTAGGLLRSEDGGFSFRPGAAGGTAVTRLEWPGPALLAATSAGLLVSDDAGGGFEEPRAGLPAGAVTALAVSSFFAVDPVLFVAVGGQGVFRSSDRGRSFTLVGHAGRRVNDLAWLGPLLYAAADDGLYRSEDAGHNWTRLGEGLEGRRLARLLFPLAPDSAAEAFVATDDGVHRTLDGGAHWQKAGLQGHAVDVLATFPPPQPKLKRRR